MEQIFENLVNRYFNEFKELQEKILEKKDKFLSYADYVIKWNKQINVTGFTKEKFVFNGLIEPLLILKKFNDFSQKITDIGTGAGIPSISYAIFFDSLEIHAIEVNKKKLALLNVLKYKIKLENLFIDSTVPESSLFVVSRAFMNINKFLQFLNKEKLVFKYLIFYFKDNQEFNASLDLIENVEYSNPFKKEVKFIQSIFYNKKFNGSL